MEQPSLGEPSVGSQTDRIESMAREALLDKCRLLPEAARLQSRPILRDGAVCGLHFAVRGPRDVLLTAVWDAESGTLWCYDSRGERFLRTEVS